MRLTPHTLEAVRDLLGGQSVEDASVWADRIRGQRRNTSPLHYVNIPLSAAGYVPARDCPDGRCIIAAVDSFARILADSGQSTSQRAEALRFLIHLVADLHQPLHVADNHDRGGNLTQVRFGGRGTNLHKVWDGELIEYTGLSEADYLRRLCTRMASLPLDSFEAGTVVDWATEGHGIARRLAYNVPSNRQIGPGYVNASLPEMDLALIKAGVRLAKLLNTSLGRYTPSPHDLGTLPAGSYSDEEAAAHVGEVANVVGIVVTVKTSRAGNTFLNFGGDYPHQTFSAVLLSPQHSRLQRLDSLQGRRIQVRGLIRLYKGQPEIVVEVPEQIVSLP